MNIPDIGPIIILCFILITYLFSAYEKINDWKAQLEFYSKMFQSTFIAKAITPVIVFILGLEVIISTLTGLGIWDIIVNESYVFSVYALIASSILFTMLLFGLRMVKDYVGSARIAIYFLLSVFGLYWTQSMVSIA
ncbi:DoxX family protein [Nonlabens antarcticus]|uniref:DoxX family protein n=1 Tax=Nonlabens antarcticus TaxID=392714 RepID=UPI001891C88E|nr:DoxX family protein [Nonlabens antarcticus]